jgi:hypothetical protein
MPGPASERVRENRVIVLPEQRILFVPIPKSGCTSVKWHLAGLAGLSADRFAGSRARDVTKSLAIHDMTLWDDQFRWSSLTPEAQQAILADDDWLRLAVVRDPASRLWSAWQSKLLLAEPRFVRRFAGESWFPHDLSSVDRVLAQFRTFVKVLSTADPPDDSHWGPQHPMVSGFNLNFIGRAERPDLTWARLGDQVPGSVPPDDLPRENRSLLPYSPAVYDAGSAAVLNSVFSEDIEQFGYSRLTVAGNPGWRKRAAGVLPMLDELRHRHVRIGELLDLLRDSDAQIVRLERRLAKSAARERKSVKELQAMARQTDQPTSD